MVIAATSGFPETSAFSALRGLYPTALHMFLPAGQILQDDEGRQQISGFLEAVKITGEHLARNEPIPDSVKEQLEVEYTDEQKIEIMQKHNLYSASRSKSI